MNFHEYNCILTCIRARIAQSLINGCYCSGLNPNDSYITNTQMSSWALLCVLNETGDEKIYSLWNSILKEKYKIDVTYLEKSL